LDVVVYSKWVCSFVAREFGEVSGFPGGGLYHIAVYHNQLACYSFQWVPEL
jgi:hypothetical protein